MAILYECDICKKTIRSLVNVTISRSTIASPGATPRQERFFSFDVCGSTCEARAIAQILSRIIPVAAESADPKEEGVTPEPKLEEPPSKKSVCQCGHQAWEHVLLVGSCCLCPCRQFVRGSETKESAS